MTEPIVIDSFAREKIRTLKEGDIVIGPDGKKYRAKKTVLPQEHINGPHGIGDPEDKSLRKIEADVLIPNIMNKQIESVECRLQFLDLIKCMKKEGGAMGLRRCNEPRDLLNACKKEKFTDPAFRQKMTESYLEERSAARRTGMTAQQRDLQKYRDWKKDH